jgi:CrcB protein
VRAAHLPITRPERFGQSDTVKVLLIAVAGAAGALARYGIGTAVGPRDFPWQTLGINLAGSFALGFLLRSGDLRGWSDVAVAAVGVGFLGAFTTFSTFSVETQSMLRDGRAVTAIGYVLASVVGGVALAAAGYALATTRGA